MKEKQALAVILSFSGKYGEVATALPVEQLDTADGMKNLLKFSKKRQKTAHMKLISISRFSVDETYQGPSCSLNLKSAIPN